MSEFSKIEWCDHTFNPWIGCTKVSPGCANCYAEQQDKFRKWTPEGWGKGAPRKRTSEANWKKVEKWNREAEGLEGRPRVFCASLADWLDDEVPVAWLVDLLELIRSTPNLDWLLLTKRPENFVSRLGKACASICNGKNDESAGWMWEWGVLSMPRENVWVGTTVEDQLRADERIPKLLEIPGKVRFLSAEPLLEPVSISGDYPVRFTCDGIQSRIHWVICGGESGPGARPFALEWADDLRRQCEKNSTAFFMKQVGAQPYFENVNLWDEFDEPDCAWLDFLTDAPEGVDCNGAASLETSDSKGGKPEDWPEVLRVRDFPKLND